MTARLKVTCHSDDLLSGSEQSEEGVIIIDASGVNPDTPEMRQSLAVNDLFLHHCSSTQLDLMWDC